MIEYSQEKKANWGFWLFFLPILIPLGAGAWFLWVYLQVRLHYTAPVPGNPQAFDVVASLPDVQKFAGSDARLQRIEADYVSSDGTLNFEAGYKPAPHIEYVFSTFIPAPKNQPPVGAGGSENGRWIRTITIALGEKGRYGEMNADFDNHIDSSFKSQGMDKDEGYPHPDDEEPTLPPPACHFADLWKVAIEHGASKNAVAEIDYGKNGYDFTISEAGVYLDFGTDCKLTKDNSYEPSE